MDRQNFEKLMNEGAFANIANKNQPVQFEKKPAFANIANNCSDWEAPVPFDEVHILPFPVNCLPPPVADYVSALAETTQTPAEMGGLLSLGVLSTAFQGRFELEITPDWHEPLNLFLAAVAEPGERKSAVLNALTRPILEFERWIRESQKPEIAQNKTKRELLEQELAAAKTAAAKGNAGAHERALEISAELAEFEEKYPFRLIVDDTTPEKLAVILSEQGGNLTVCSSEGGIFDTMAGKYNKSENFDVFLKGHCGDNLTVDRIGRPGLFIESPHLAVTLAIQPAVLKAVLQNQAFAGRGLTARFLYAICQSRIGNRKSNPQPIPQDVKTRYERFCMSILGSNEKGIIRPSPEADEIRIAFQDHIEPLLIGGLEPIRAWGAKIVGATLRIAGLLHCATVQGNPCETPISMEVLVAATQIGECLISHALAAFQTAGADPQIENAKYILRKITCTGKNELSKRELFELVKGKLKRVSDLDAPLAILEERNFIRTAETPTGGRPTTKKLVNPMCEKHSQYSQNH